MSRKKSDGRYRVQVVEVQFFTEKALQDATDAELIAEWERLGRQRNALEQLAADSFTQIRQVVRKLDLSPLGTP